MMRGIVGALLAAAVLAACGETPAPPPQGERTPPYAVRVVSVVPGQDERWLDGRVEGINQATVAAQTSGEVVAIVRDIADRATKGEIVLRLRATQQSANLRQAEAGLAEAEARAAETATRLARIRSLFERKVVARAALDEAVAQHDSAVARVATGRAATSAAREGVAYTAVVAPFAGVITDRLVSPGTIVAPGTPLFGIAGTDRLRVVTDLPERFAETVRRRREAIALVGDQRISLQNLIVQPRAGERSGAVGLRADLPSSVQGVQPGTIVKLVVVTGEESTVRIPRASVIERGEVTGVYLFDARSGRTTFRQLRLGRQEADEVEVLAGLTGGEKVALDPARALRHLATTRTAP